MTRIVDVEMMLAGPPGDGLSTSEAAALRDDAGRAAATAATASGAVDALAAQVGSLAAQVAAAPAGTVPLPGVPNRFFHLDAQAIAGLVDGTRLAAWTDLVSGTAQAVQANAANQPAYRRAGLNGRPAVVFDTARNDHLIAAGVAPGSQAMTLFLVLTLPAPAGTRYVFGTPSTARNVYHTPTQTVGLQMSGSFEAPIVAGPPVILAAVFGASGGALVRVNGVPTLGTLGVPATAPTAYYIGHRSTLTAGQGYGGALGEVLVYNTSLGDGDLAAVERYLGAKWGIAVSPQTTWYVNSVGGTDSNDGRTPATALASLEQAWQGIAAAKATSTTVLVHAPATAPLRLKEGNVPFIREGAGVVRFAPLLPGDTWHCYATQRFTSGWTNRGGGVWSRPLALSSVTFPLALVTTLLDADGQPTRVTTKNTATPTTPAAGQFGYSGGTYYLHLPGDADPNRHEIEVAAVRVIFLARSGGRLQLDGAHLRGAQDSVVQAGSTAAGYEGGFVEATDCIAEGGLTGAWATSGATEGMRLTRCVGRYCDNDGFNHHANAGNPARMELIDCEGAYNGDEGVSPHDDTVLVLRGGRFHHNGHGGLTSVTRATTYVYGTEFDHNRRVDQTVSGWDSGGVAILEQSTLISLDLYSHDHPGPGVEIDTAAGARWTDLGGTRSGTAHGNGAPDAV